MSFRQRILATVLVVSSVTLVSVGAGQAPPAGSPATVPDFLKEYSQTRGYSLGRPARPTPLPDGSAVLFLRATATEAAQDLYEFSVATKVTKRLLSAQQLLQGVEEKLTAEEKARRERQRLQARGLSSFTVFDEGRKLLVPLSGKLFVFTRATGAIQELPLKRTPIDPQISPDSQKLAYVLEHDLFVMDLTTLRETRLTTGGTAEVSHGIAEFVAQEEMNRHHGYWWTPDSKTLVYQESDARDVEVWRVADPGNPGGKPLEQRYPRPGKNNVKVRLGSVPASGGPTTWIKWDAEQFPYLTQVMAAKNAPLTIGVQNRFQQEIQYRTVDLSTGETKLLYSQRDPAWVNIEQDFPRWLKDGSTFLVTREEAAGTALELRRPTQEPNSPGLILVRAEDNFMDLVGVDEQNGVVYFISAKEPMERHLCRVNLPADANGSPPSSAHAPVPMTKTPGVHRAVFSKNHAIYCLTSNEPGKMPVTTVHQADGQRIGELPSVALEPPFQPTTRFTHAGSDPRFYCAITRPRAYDPKLKYPVVVAVYGGPSLQTVQRTTAGQLLNQHLADQGFIVVNIDNRGTPGRGRGWERRIHKSFGKVPLEDQVAALQALGAKHPEMDLKRVGIRGWSFGGYMSALAVLRRPEVFHAAVAGAPVTDWEDYDTHYTERYLGLPQENKAGYEESSLLPLAPKLERPLLLVHGTADDNVYFVHSLKLAAALFKAGRDFELLPIVGSTHGIADPLARRRFEERCATFFKKHLGQPTAR